MDEAMAHCARGASVWKFAGSEEGGEPDIVLACAGDVPTLEACAAAWLLRKYVPEIRVRLVNVVDLGVLMSPDANPHGADDITFESLFTRAVPVIFAFHGYPWVIHSVVHGRANESRFHVRGYMNEGTTTTPFDMVVLNRMSRFHLAMEALKYVPRLRSRTSDVIDRFNQKLYEHQVYTRQNFADLPEIANWHWTDDFSQPTHPPALAKDQPRMALFTNV
jgi:xylulose-5-phosphate/fructose-6-phosphate phosphoketolase